MRPPSSVTACTVHRSPFFTQSVAVIRSRRSLLRVMIVSPALTADSSPRATSAPAGALSLASRSSRARLFSWDTNSRVGASMIESRPASVSAAHPR